MSETLYQTVYNTIIQRIADGAYAPGSMLPSEFDLGGELGVSQGTARKALAELERKRIVERRQGRGTFVTLRTPENSLFHFFRLRTSDGSQVVPELESDVVTRRKATRQEAGALHGTPGEVFEIARVRSFRKKPICYETSVVPAELFPGLAERAPLPNTLYVLFQQAYSCVLMKAEDRLRAGVLGPEISGILGVDPNTPAIIGDRKGFDLLGRVIELRTSHYITDGVTYSVTLD